MNTFRRFCLISLAVALALSAHGVTLDGDLVSLTFDDKGCLASIKEKTSGRELVARKRSFILLKSEGRERDATSFSAGNGRLAWKYAGLGEIVLRVDPFDGGWTFTLAECTVPSPQKIMFGRISPVCTEFRGYIANMLSDGTSAVVMRGYSPDARMQLDPYLHVFADCERPYRGMRFGLAAGPKSRIRDALKAMTIAAGVPRSDKGGAWSMDSAMCRRSYLMAFWIGEKSAPWWAELAERGGIGAVHFDLFHKTYGTYQPHPKLFPNGLASLSNAVASVHAAGLTAEMHTLTDSISFNDPMICPEAPDDLIAVYRYTLAKPLDATNNTDEIVVNEKPGSKHDIALSYIGNGNILQIGTELVQYSGVSTNAPWRFTGIKRGVFGSKIKKHEAGDTVKYLWQHFISLFAEPETPLGEKLYDNIARVLSFCDFDAIYLDGIDGLAPWMWRYNAVAHGIYSACLRHGKAPFYEDSCWSSYPWWFHSRIGAWDYPRWAPKMFTDRHLRDVVRKSRDENLLEPQLGWWKIRGSSGRAPGFRVDDNEYFAAKCAAVDAAASWQLSKFNMYPWTFEAPGKFPFIDVRMFTYTGWYERFRLARAFTDDAVALMAKPGQDVRLRQDDRGEWKLTPCEYDLYRITSAETKDWRVRSDVERKGCAMRFEALHPVEPYSSTNAFEVFTPANAAVYETNTVGPTVTLAREFVQDGPHGPSLRFSATNTGKSRRGAWARIIHREKHPYVDMHKNAAMGLWVKGDGSGALLNVQASTPREWFVSYSDFYVTLDFKGWRYFAFPLRERNSEQSAKYEWPYSKSIFSLCREVEMRKISGVGLYLNEIPAGGRAEVEVSAVKALPLAEYELDDVTVTVNGVRHAIPFKFAQGDVAELEDGVWTKYSGGGDPIERRAAEGVVELKAGENILSFSAKSNVSGTAPRAEVVVRKDGRPVPALGKPRAADAAAVLSYEAVEPQIYAPARGFAAFAPVKVRPGECMDLSFRVFGPIGPFRLKVGNVEKDFPALKKNESALHERAFTGMRGVNEVSISVADPSSADARFEFAKRR